MNHRRTFPVMTRVLPATKRGAPGTFYIEHHTVTQHESQMSALHGGINYVPPGRYCALKRVGNSNSSWDKLWMSDTPMEHRSNYAAHRSATGDVLVVGLGLGMVSLAMCRKKEVRSVTVLEISPAVIELVAPHVAHRKLRIILANGELPPLRGRHFDFVYVDIWSDFSAEIWPNMKLLLAEYRKYRRPGGKVDGWMKEYVQQEHNKPDDIW